MSIAVLPAGQSMVLFMDEFLEKFELNHRDSVYR